MTIDQDSKTAVLAGDAKPDRVVCFCFDVTAGQITDFLADAANTVEALVNDTGLGTKCTACLLDADLLIDACQRSRHGVGSSVPREDRDRNFGLKASNDAIDSGFFVARDDIATTLRIVNRGLLLDRQTPQIPFAYTIRVLEENGRLATGTTGRLEPEHDLELDLGSLPNCPRQGWFWFDLHPLGVGCRGSTRAQVLLTGPGWSAAYHTQPHASACRAKSVVLLDDGDGLRTSVSLINGLSARPARATLTLTAMDCASWSREGAITLPANGSTMADLDDLFGDQPKDVPLMLAVVSDVPVRKHVINVHRDGAWSLDHFPNAK